MREMTVYVVRDRALRAMLLLEEIFLPMGVGGSVVAPLNFYRAFHARNDLELVAMLCLGILPFCFLGIGVLRPFRRRMGLPWKAVIVSPKGLENARRQNFDVQQLRLLGKPGEGVPEASAGDRGQDLRGRPGKAADRERHGMASNAVDRLVRRLPAEIVDGGPVLIPRAFWASCTPEEFEQIVKDSKLGPLQCIRVWKMLGRSDACPAELEIAVALDDIPEMMRRMIEGLQ